MEIREEIFKEVPVGFGKNDQKQADEAKVYQQRISLPYSKEVQEIVDYGPFALGTLGGGNHFIELGVSLKNQVWLIIHTGSRSVGHGIGSYYMKKAAGEGKPESLCSLESESPEGQNYIKDMNFALEWDKVNRSLIMYRVKKALESVVGPVNPTGMLINRNHNHAELKEGLWIHRKGATHAEEGMRGVIPGNMRDGCFIVKGKGSPDSLSSSSHGAGRVMSRSKAKKMVSFEDFKETMKDIPGATVRESTIDESPFAYKDIWEVMRLQEDLVEIEEYIKPVVPFL